MSEIGLEGAWTLRRLSDGSDRVMLLPGDIISALVERREAKDPYYALGELEDQWVGREDWLIERDIELDSSFLEAARIFLELDTVDTLAEILVNGELLGKSRSMFVPFSADARPLLHAGKNRIGIVIHSPELAAIEAAQNLPYPIPGSEFPISSPHRNLIRKMQCMAGWDWGPCLMTGGIYDGLRLRAEDGAKLDYLTVRMRRTQPAASAGKDRWKLWITLWADCPLEAEYELSASIAGVSHSGKVSLEAGKSSATIILDDIEAEAWWPRGYGKQVLYELKAGIRDAKGKGAGSQQSRQIGFRELKVINEEDEAGKSLAIQVNGRQVFCKGANWIPADALPSRWNAGRLDALLTSAVDANMNCLRVWGGGRYESEDFYRLCDEKGILIWQDCSFACSTYPSHQEFLDLVEEEIRHQARRLQSHACLAIWCGNNEDLGALGWYPEAKANPMRYVVDYDRLNEGTLGRIVRELDPDRMFWPTSPCGGPNDYADNWHKDGRGDMHFWSVWHEGKSFSEYLTVKPRFCSEFGFQSFPSPQTVASFAPPGERNITSPVMEHHQRHNRGNTIIVETMARYFRLPRGQHETLYLSQVQQAMAIRTAVDYWRSLRPICMGTLYWQLNDVWPVSSWSSLDYDGSWKLLHHEARHFFDPLRLALIVKDGSVSAFAFNDHRHAYMSRLELRLRDFSGKILAEYQAETLVQPDSSTEVLRLDLARLPAPANQSFLEGILEFERASCGSGGVSQEAAGKTDGRLRRSATAFLCEAKKCSLQDPGLTWKLKKGEAGLELAVSASKAPAFSIAPWILPIQGKDRLGGRFDDALFALMPGEDCLLHFIPETGKEPPSVEELESRLRIFHLFDSYE